MDGRSICPMRPLLFILFGIRLVASIAPSRLCRFSKLVAHCTGRWIAQRRKRKRMARRRGKGCVQSMHYVGVGVCVEILNMNCERSSVNFGKCLATSATYRQPRNAQFSRLLEPLPNPSFYERLR